ncbi:MAG: hypothetical protein LBU23_03435 [Planctomycetota bacterium]|jgi:hypothetical protein|nr:hypothetical protein [Planctomycetota bacterium]
MAAPFGSDPAAIFLPATIFQGVIGKFILIHGEVNIFPKNYAFFKNLWASGGLTDMSLAGLAAGLTH